MERLCVGVANDDSRYQYRRIMREPASRGAEAILLGNTEIERFVGPDDAPVPLFDTTRVMRAHPKRSHPRRMARSSLKPRVISPHRAEALRPQNGGLAA
jgi:hypothetical protein